MTTDRDQTPDRDDALLERLLAGTPPADDDERAARAPYERLVHRLREFEGASPSSGWDERARARLRAVQAREARRRRIMVGGAFAAIAAAVLLVWWARGAGSAAPQVAVVVRSALGDVRRGTAALDDTLQVDVTGRRAHVELRLYLDATLVVRCPGAPVCGDTGARLIYRLSRPGRYQLVVLDSAAPLPPPHDGGLDADVLAARRAGARVVRPEPLLVTP